MHCVHCGADNPEGSAFCQNCGSKLDSGETVFNYGAPNSQNAQNNSVRDEEIEAKKSAVLKKSIISVCVQLVLFILVYVVAIAAVITAVELSGILYYDSAELFDEIATGSIQVSGALWLMMAMIAGIVVSIIYLVKSIKNTVASAKLIKYDGKAKAIISLILSITGIEMAAGFSSVYTIFMAMFAMVI